MSKHNQHMQYICACSGVATTLKINYIRKESCCKRARKVSIEIFGILRAATELKSAILKIKNTLKVHMQYIDN